MGWLNHLWRDVVIFPVVGLVSLILAGKAGWLRRSALRMAPVRRVGLTAHDLVMGLIIMCFGMVLTPVIFKRLGWLSQPAGLHTDAQVVPGQDLPGVLPSQFMQQALVFQLVVHLPVCLYVVWRSTMGPGGIQALGIWPTRPIRDFLVGLIGLVFAVPIALGLGVAVTTLGEKLIGQPTPQIGHEMLSVLQQSTLWWVTTGLLLSALIVAPLLEEIAFRGLMQTAMLSIVGQSHRWLVVLFVSVMFTLVHVGLPWQVLPSLFALGVILGWLYEYTGSLWPSILVHVGFNTVNVVLALW